MARAKQTRRAEARRRYRQAVAQTAADEDASGADEETAESSGASPRRSSAPTASGRPSLTGALREAYHRPHYREDLAALPGLLTLRSPTRIAFTRTVVGIPWFLVSAALVVIGFVALMVRTIEGTFIAQFLVLPPGGPTLPVLVVGFTAARASYLLGFLVGLLDLVLIAIFVSLDPTAQATGVSLTDLLVQGVVYGLPTSVLFAAFAAWYRRFLTLSSLRREQMRGASRGRGGGRPASRR